LVNNKQAWSTGQVRARGIGLSFFDPVIAVIISGQLQQAMVTQLEPKFPLPVISSPSGSAYSTFSTAQTQSAGLA